MDHDAKLIAVLADGDGLRAPHHGDPRRSSTWRAGPAQGGGPELGECIHSGAGLGCQRGGEWRGRGQGKGLSRDSELRAGVTATWHVGVVPGEMPHGRRERMTQGCAQMGQLECPG